VETMRTGSLVQVATDPLRTLAERHDAFGEIVALHQRMACSCAHALLGDPILAEDAVQQAFVTAWRHLERLRVPDAFPGWFKRIVLTECHRIRRRGDVRPIPVEGSTAVSDATPEHDVEAAELRDLLSSAIARLPENERVVVTLFYVQELSHAEMSRCLDVPTTTVAKRLHSAKRRLQKLLPIEVLAAYGDRPLSADDAFVERVRSGIYDTYVGRYRFDVRPDLTVTIKREGNRLVSEAAGQRNELCLAATPQGELRAREFDGVGRFLKDRRGRVTHFVYYEHGREMGVATKIS
jgi:RNA polymerase sigma factor (sigma-70 family)